MGVVYVWTKDDAPVYVGYTTRALPVRTKEHITAASRGNVQVLGAAIRKYGSRAFEVKPQLVCSDVDTLKEYEKYLIKSLQPRYNLTEGGDACFHGKHHTQESKNKMSKSVFEAQRGRVFSDEHREKISASMRELSSLRKECLKELQEEEYLAELERKISWLQAKLQGE